MTNFIQRTSGAISEQECNTVIDFFENNKERHYKGSVGSDARLDSRAKKDTEINISLKELIEDSRLTPVARGLKNACDEYVENYPFLLKLREWCVFNTLKIQKYNPNEAYFVLN